MKIDQRFLNSVVVILISSAFLSCGTTSIVVPVMRPAEINLGKLKRVAVGRIGGIAGREVEDDLITQLVETQSFDVLDRSNLDQILREHQLSATDLMDERTALEIGRFIGAAALITGRVSEYKYDEEVLEGKPYKDKDGKPRVEYTRDGKARVTVNFRVTDVTTGKYLFARDIAQFEGAQTKAIDHRPMEIDKGDVLKAARKIVVDKFVRKVAAHWENVSVKFLTDSDLPELESGISYARVREWDRATEVFRAAAEKYRDNKNVYKAYYDLGVAHEYNARFQEAVEAFNKGYELSGNSDCLSQIESCRQREREYKRLQEQMEKNE